MRLLFLNVTPEMDCCGVLICKNDDVTMEMIQEKIDDLKIAAEEAGKEWDHWKPSKRMGDFINTNKR